MNGLCDVHCHILPGLDDGSPTMEETVQVLREAVKQGIRQIIVTPHFHPGRYMVYASQINESLEELRRVCASEKLNMEFYCGQECYYFTGLVKLLDAGRVLTLAHSRYVLVEFDPDCALSSLLGAVRELQYSGYRPVIAHFERYRCLHSMDRLADLKEKEILLQMNFDTLSQKDTFFHKNPWRKLVRQGMADLLGSDCHGMGFRPLHIEEPLTWLYEQVDRDIVERMLYGNVQKIIKPMTTERI